MIRIGLPAPISPPLPAFDCSVAIDGATYTFAFQWNADEGAWFVRVLDEPGQTTLMGDFRVNADWPLYRSRTVRNPPGLLLARDSSGQGEPPGLSDLGARVQLFYLTKAEAIAAGFDG